MMKLMVVGLAGWINRHQEDVIDYLREEIRVLKELQGKKRLRFTDDQRRRLARKAKRIGFDRLKGGGLPPGAQPPGIGEQNHRAGVWLGGGRGGRREPTPNKKDNAYRTKIEVPARNGNPAREIEVIDSCTFLKEFVVMDDNAFPYRLLGRTGNSYGEDRSLYEPPGFAMDDILSVVCPLPEKVYLTASRARKIMAGLLGEYLARFPDDFPSEKEGELRDADVRNQWHGVQS